MRQALNWAERPDLLTDDRSLTWHSTTKLHRSNPNKLVLKLKTRRKKIPQRNQWSHTVGEMDFIFLVQANYYEYQIGKQK